MEGWMWFALGLVVIGFIGFAVLSEMGNRNVARDKDREHELSLADREKDMYVDALRKPPTNIFQSRGRQIPDLLGRSRVGRVRWNDDEVQPQVFSAELMGEPDDTEERLDNLEVLVSGSRENVAASAALVRASQTPEPEPTEPGADSPDEPAQEDQA